MKRSDLDELHYITPIENVVSIMQRGILSHRRAQRLKHSSVAMQEVQNRRATIRVPGGRLLHEYANLYICARNPMLYKRLDHHLDLCVLRVSTDVLDLPGVVITDGNAASVPKGYTSFRASPAGLAYLNRDLVFAEYWTDDDQIVYWRKKRMKCAEVLVPDVVESRFIMGSYVSCSEAEQKLRETSAIITTTINEHLFFCSS